MDLDGCRLQPDAAREILGGLRERAGDDAYAEASGERLNDLTFVRLSEGNQVHREDALAISKELRRARARSAARFPVQPTPILEKENPPPPPPITQGLKSSPAVSRQDGEKLVRKAASWTAGSPRTVPLIESPRSTATPLVACLFASPLAWQDSHGKLHGIEGLDGDAELLVVLLRPRVPAKGKRAGAISRACATGGGSGGGARTRRGGGGLTCPPED